MRAKHTFVLLAILWTATQVSAGDGLSGDVRFLRLLDTAGKMHAVMQVEERTGTVYVFLSPTSSISRDYLAELNELAKSLPSGFSLFGVVSERTVSRADTAAFASDAEFPILFDASGDLATALEPTHAPEAFLIDSSGTIVYRGRIDDRYSATDQKKEQADQNDLLASIEALSAGSAPLVAKTDPVGTKLSLASPEETLRDVNFNRDIAPIVFANCAECHRPGQVAPFALLDFESTAKRSRFVSEITSSRLMPPWKAAVGYGHFADERVLTDHAIRLIEAWDKASTPEGNAADLPSTPTFPEGWQLGEPDVVVEVPAPYDVPADGPDIFQHFVLPVEIPEDKTLIGFEYRPSNPAVAHHAVLFLDESGRSRARDAETPEPGYRTSGSVEGGATALVGVWTPGMTPRTFPEGIGIRFPQKVDVVLQLHLHPSGKPETEQSKVALYFSDVPPSEVKKQDMLLLGSIGIDIPAGTKRHTIESSITLPVELTALSVFPHLHMIGKEMKVTATLPSGEALPLIWIKDWNFYWQDSYLYKEPVRLPKGTRIDIETSYDNSAENPLNPSVPPKRVLFGNGSADEMCFVFFQIVADERRVMARLTPSLIQSFLKQWRQADIDDEASEKIVDEAGKLFGRRATTMLRRMLMNKSDDAGT